MRAKRELRYLLSSEEQRRLLGILILDCSVSLVLRGPVACALRKVNSVKLRGGVEP